MHLCSAIFYQYKKGDNIISEIVMLFLKIVGIFLNEAK